jgi:hypothetical protein
MLGAIVQLRRKVGVWVGCILDRLGVRHGAQASLGSCSTIVAQTVGLHSQSGCRRLFWVLLVDSIVLVCTSIFGMHRRF